MVCYELNFFEFVQGFWCGELLEIGDLKLFELIEVICEIGGNGSLMLKISFKINKVGQIEVVFDISIKKLMCSMGIGIYFVIDDGWLICCDLNQMDFEDEFECCCLGED